MAARISSLVPMAHVADVQRSIEFYGLLGLKVRGTLKNNTGKLLWAHVHCEMAELMLTGRTDANVTSQHGVAFYMYSPDLAGLREKLLAAKVSISEITYPSFMPKGEMCLEDPDGYVIFVGQSG